MAHKRGPPAKNPRWIWLKPPGSITPALVGPTNAQGRGRLGNSRRAGPHTCKPLRRLQERGAWGPTLLKGGQLCTRLCQQGLLAGKKPTTKEELHT